MICIDNPRAYLERQPNPDDCWLHCDECRRFFQYRDAQPTGLFPKDACPFPDCTGYGIGFNIFIWDDLREPDDPRWPSDVAQLEHGMSSPDMAVFYEAQLAERIHRMVSDFARSSELREAIGDGVPRYLGSFLQMMSDLCWDLTDEEDAGYFSEDSAGLLVSDLPVWSQTANPDEAPRMTAELRAFFAFAERTGCVKTAKQWRRFVAGDLDAMFRHSMRTDRRLRRVRRMATQPAATRPDPRHGMRRKRKGARRGARR